MFNKILGDELSPLKIIQMDLKISEDFFFSARGDEFVAWWPGYILHLHISARYVMIEVFW